MLRFVVPFAFVNVICVIFIRVLGMGTKIERSGLRKYIVSTIKKVLDIYQNYNQPSRNKRRNRRCLIQELIT